MKQRLTSVMSGPGSFLSFPFRHFLPSCAFPDALRSETVRWIIIDGGSGTSKVAVVLLKYEDVRSMD